ncbi:putative transferase [Helianthus annuus]|nr:putative transferase [Helianthus annuus]
MHHDHINVCSYNLKLLSVYLKVTLEAEVTNKGALALYGRLGFIRAKRLFRYYLNGVDAFRLKLLFPHPELPSGISSVLESYEANEAKKDRSLTQV